ncbi:HNH endonuclease [Microbacterium sp. PF5]|uniref:HNH endonuclease n=1 Tax=Microbacterium sp. PF5 TaxID=2305435 RepID=UPI00144448D5|nr:HNH endonuclease [Microbacterium sp. PF5]
MTGVVGRADGRGVPELTSATLQFEDGTTIDTVPPPIEGVTRGAEHVPVAFEYAEFDRCPICLTPDPDSREHVPPHSLGGSVLTATCERCNNEFGSRYEPHALAWYENALGNARVSGSTVPGKRHAGTYLFRLGSDGSIVLFQQGKYDKAVLDILSNGDAEITYDPVDVERAKLAFVKSAYLAACVLVQRIPDGPKATTVREELLAAREHPRDAPFISGPAVRALKIGRNNGDAHPGEIRLMVIHADEGRELGVSFNRRIIVDWPLDPLYFQVSAPRLPVIT